MYRPWTPALGPPCDNEVVLSALARCECSRFCDPGILRVQPTSLHRSQGFSGNDELSDVLACGACWDAQLCLFASESYRFRGAVQQLHDLSSLGSWLPPKDF